ncbi:hypothetical protein LIPSTDRAFT_108171 [Lipomyces starkeyi NRRL Y-11557]|uniref:Zn(2)-C6 fungal-type domain-containing protein n=1 Tax=Lipomyces starkeyi NRRL Y-11557 TaxID=675824 RepID=A0A1E3PUW0_LIPST|nr:hypothetical protein LIPSTDRAFT_108171 [Lipomyces starkeyi NRRL Y-11557]
MYSDYRYDASGSSVVHDRAAWRSAPEYLQSEGFPAAARRTDDNQKKLTSTRYNQQEEKSKINNKHAREPTGLYNDRSGSPITHLSPTQGHRGEAPLNSEILGGYRSEVDQTNDSDHLGVYFKRRAPRTSQACKACRVAKSKCDEMRTCANCVHKNIECIRDDPQLKAKTISTLPDISSRLDQIMQSQEAFQRALIKTFPTLEGQIILEKRIVAGAANEGYAITQLERMSTTSPTADTIEISMNVQESNSGNWDDHGAVERKRTPAMASMLAMPTIPTIPPDHTTGWARILYWPAIADIVGDCMRSEGLSFDPFKQESERGLLNPTEECLNADFALSYDAQYGSKGGENSESTLAGASESMSGQHSFRGRPSDEYEKDGEGLNAQDALDLDFLSVQRLTDCYISKIAVMHPIVAPKRLRILVSEFRSVLPNVKMMLSVAGAEHRSDCTARRAFSNEKWHRSSHRYIPPWDVHQSINIAIVLLILALGQVCEDVSGTRSATRGSEWQSVARTTAAIGSGHGSRSSRSRISRHIPTFPSEFPKGSSKSTRVPSPGVKNAELRSSQPGLAFFEAARALMASQVCGNTAEHVQANLLTGLYYGQLSRILESHTHYFNASRALYIILNPRRPHIEAQAAMNKKLSDEDNQLVITFWTCLQLESDILAELDVPQSPILAWESTMPWPDLEAAVSMGHDLQNMECYMALLWLRRRLNHIHAELYGPGIQDGVDVCNSGYTLSHMNHMVRLPFIDSLRESLEGYDLIAPSWAWSADDCPSQNMLAARLRAKYFGGVVIIYRPFLRMVLNYESKYVAQAAEDVSLDPISPLIIRYAGNCVDALIKSTQAFQNIRGSRPIVTNPWGTAYAQFGNVLLLLAVYQNRSLRRLIDLECLNDLTIRTLNFLDNVGQSSPALRNAHRVLEIAASKVLCLHEEEVG